MNRVFNLFNPTSRLVLILSVLILGSMVALMSIPIILEGTARANIVQPETSETSAILDIASLIAFTGASAVENTAESSLQKMHAEILKNLKESASYDPQTGKRPSDSSALDEPWLASTSGMMDGMAVPHWGNNDEDEEPADIKEMETAKSPIFKGMIKLLKPIPNAMISSPFGYRWGHPHQGIDFAAPMGTPIESAECGKVIYSGWEQGYGNFIAIDHGHGYETHYAHCSKILVQVGQKVRKGQVIGRVGSTGHSTGPHLHFEVIANGLHRNPVKFFAQPIRIVQLP